jgi:hypothetical protein
MSYEAHTAITLSKAGSADVFAPVAHGVLFFCVVFPALYIVTMTDSVSISICFIVSLR